MEGILGRSFKPAAGGLFFFLALGIWLGWMLTDVRLLFLVCFTICCLFFCLGHCRFIFLCISLCCWGGFSFQAIEFEDLPSNHISHFQDQGKFTITGSTVDFTKGHGEKHSTVLDCRKLTDPKGHTFEVTGKIRLSIYGKSASLPRIYDSLVFTSKIKSMRNFKNPGRFDFKGFSKLHNIYGSAHTHIRKLKYIQQDRELFFGYKMMQELEYYRNKFSSFVLEQTQNSASGSIIVSLVTGKKELISHQTRDLFSKAGISHLLAISGLHLSIIALLFYKSCYLVLFQLFYCASGLFSGKCRAKIFLIMNSGQIKKLTGLLTLIPLVLYALLTGFSPSSQRALIMVSVFLFSFVLENETDPFSSLSVAGLLILLFDPASLFSISFQLSFTAVSCILFGMSLINMKSKLFSHYISSKFFGMMLVTFFAGFGTFPLTAHYFHMVSCVQIITNLFAIPMVGFFVLPAGILYFLYFNFSGPGPEWILTLLEWTVNLVMSWSIWLTAFDFSWVRIANLPWVQVILSYFGMVCLLLWVKKKKRKFLFLVCAVCTVFLWIQVQTDPIETDQLTVTTLDVGQGFCALVQGPDQTDILVDGGGYSPFSSFDPGRHIVAPFLWRKGIKSLDTIILTHPESDHLNGLVYILENFKVRQLIKNKDVKQSRSYRNLILACEKQGTIICHPKMSPEEMELGRIKAVFYNGVEKTDNSNNRSLVFKIGFNAFSMLFTGDILKEREKRLSRIYGDKLASIIMVAPHHGSASSSRKIFLDKVKPESVIIPCGWNNRYGFPHQRVLDRFKQSGIDIYRTDVDGAVFIKAGTTKYQITTYGE